MMNDAKIESVRLRLRRLIVKGKLTIPEAASALLLNLVDVALESTEGNHDKAAALLTTTFQDAATTLSRRGVVTTIAGAVANDTAPPA